ncbi:beta-galactosidase trimerization domain-containing protein [Paenibacillus sp. MCAF20]
MAYDSHIPVDIVSDDTDFSRYKLIVLPHYMMARPDIVTKLYAYVRGGGTAVLDYRAGSKLWNNRMDDKPLPGVYRELAGILVTDYGTLRPNERRALERSDNAIPSGQGQGSTWFDVIELESESSESLIRYADDYVAGKQAAVRNRYGNGHAYYIGTDPDNDTLHALMNQAAEDAGVVPIGGITAPPGVEVARRRTDEGDVLFVMNHSGLPQQIVLEQSFCELACERPIAPGSMQLQPEDVLVLVQIQPAE